MNDAKENKKLKTCYASKPYNWYKEKPSQKAVTKGHMDSFIKHTKSNFDKKSNEILKKKEYLSNNYSLKQIKRTTKETTDASYDHQSCDPTCDPPCDPP